jgi:hypothetical protein
VLRKTISFTVNIAIKYTVDKVATATVLICLCGLLFGCNSSDNDIKAIWSYEQRQSANPDFRFYPLETKTVGQVTVNDSLTFIKKSLVQPVDTLLQQNSTTLRSLLQMQTLYVRSDMETMRENIAAEIGPLEASQKWLNAMKAKMENYRNMPSDKVLLRKVECRFEYEIPLTSKKETKDKIYYIHTTSGNVVQAEEKPLVKPAPSH